MRQNLNEVNGRSMTKKDANQASRIDSCSTQTQPVRNLSSRYGSSPMSILASEHYYDKNSFWEINVKRHHEKHLVDCDTYASREMII